MDNKPDPNNPDDILAELKKVGVLPENNLDELSDDNDSD